MRGYQYYEFCSIHNPLSLPARKEMDSLSSRANVGTHTASYVYNYGDFRGKPKQMVLKYFDVFFYISNFGTVELMFKYPVTKINLEKLKEYAIQHVVDIEQYDDVVLLDISLCNEEGFGWTEGKGILANLLPLYDELMRDSCHFLQVVAAIHKEFTGCNSNAVAQFLAKDNLLSKAEQAFIECVGSEYRAHA